MPVHRPGRPAGGSPKSSALIQIDAHRRHGHGWAGKIAVQTEPPRKTGGHGAAQTTLGPVSDSRVTSQTVRYRERLYGAVVVVAAGAGLAAILAKEVNMGIRTLPEWLPYAVLGAVAAGMLLAGRTGVGVVAGTGSESNCGPAAHLPTDVGGAALGGAA